MKLNLTDVIQYLKDNPNVGRVKFARHFKISDSQAKKYLILKNFINDNTINLLYNNIDDESVDNESIKVEKELNENNGVVKIKGQTIKTDFIEQDVINNAIKEAGINKDEWIISKTKISHWNTTLKLKERSGNKPWEYIEKPCQVTNWLVSIELKPNKSINNIDVINKIIDKSISIRPIKLKKSNKKDENYAFELIPTDVHFGLQAFMAETLLGECNLEQTSQKFQESCIQNIENAMRYPISQIYFIVGNDIAHFENPMGTTTRSGHLLDVCARLPHVMQACEESLIKICDMLVQICNVKIIWVPGNHDYLASYALCRLLRQRYLNYNSVEIDTGLSETKSIEWGDLFIMLKHDGSASKQNKTINEMPIMFPQECCRTRWWEAHVGHKHNLNTVKTNDIFTVGKAIIRQFPGLCAPDRWSVSKGFTDSVPACNGVIMHKKRGVVATLNANVDYRL
jgi:hypothetical protein